MQQVHLQKRIELSKKYLPNPPKSFVRRRQLWPVGQLFLLKKIIKLLK